MQMEPVGMPKTVLSLNTLTRALDDVLTPMERIVLHKSTCSDPTEGKNAMVKRKRWGATGTKKSHKKQMASKALFFTSTSKPRQ